MREAIKERQRARTWLTPGVHEAKEPEFEICHGDTLTNPWGRLRELNSA